MSVSVWTDNAACRLALACEPCRDSSPAGVAWRAHMSKTAAIPEVCPFGVPIDAKAGLARAMPVSLTVGGRACCGGKVALDTFVPVPANNGVP